MVAGAQSADLLVDLRGAITKAIESGTGIEAFRKDFKKIVAKHGWTGWTGEESAARTAWRTKVIYQTNMSTSYAAGRWQQLNDPELLKAMPYWQYKHSDSVVYPRPLHQSWDGLTLPPDHSFWKQHYPPNGWGCQCRVIPVTKAAFMRAVANGRGPANAPPAGDTEGIDVGFEYAPGESSATQLLRVQRNKLENWDREIAKENVQYLIRSNLFKRFFNGEIKGEFPFAVLSKADQDLIQSDNATVLISDVSIADHIAKHPEITLDDYLKVQQIIDSEETEIYKQGDTRLMYLYFNDVQYRAVLKRTNDKLKNYFLTLFRNDRKQVPVNAVRVK
ncbi:phage minor head protein [Undibacterium sp. WLX3042]|uniref:phage head morphogenesis protein n=1 Tax=Undibacterium sp. WLX3042 TaxID=3412686 RepID=UPI003C300124